MIYMARPICTGLLLLVDKLDEYLDADKDKIINSNKFVLLDDSLPEFADKKLSTGKVYCTESGEVYQLRSIGNVIQKNALASVNNVDGYLDRDESLTYTGYRYLHLLEGLT